MGTHGNAKVSCKSTGHDMPCRLHIVKEYINGAKYKKTKWYTHDFTQYEPYIVPAKDNKKMLFCKLTGTTIPMTPEKVETHVQCKRYKAAKAEHEKRVAKRDAKKAKRKEMF